MKLFWQEQQKYIRTSKSSQIRYHPAVIKFCLAIAAKSPSAYREMRYNESVHNLGQAYLFFPVKELYGIIKMLYALKEVLMHHL